MTSIITIVIKDIETEIYKATLTLCAKISFAKLNNGYI